VCALAGLVACGACDTAPFAGPSKRIVRPGKNRIHTPPVIRTIAASLTRVEVDEAVAVTAVVEDDETPVGQLTYVWSAPVGTFSGSGASVIWRLPKGSATTPVDVILSVTVTERYSETAIDGTIVQREHQVTASLAAPLRVHDSVAEISRMAISFLVEKFGNSTVPPGVCLVDFSDLCESGKSAELSDIIDNREKFVILSAQASVRLVELNGARTEAFVVASCRFEDRRISTGELGVSSGDCLLTAIYDQRRWWLCSSNFSSGQGSTGSVSSLGRSRYFVQRSDPLEVELRQLQVAGFEQMKAIGREELEGDMRVDVDEDRVFRRRDRRQRGVERGHDRIEIEALGAERVDAGNRRQQHGHAAGARGADEILDGIGRGRDGHAADQIIHAFHQDHQLGTQIVDELEHATKIFRRPAAAEAAVEDADVLRGVPRRDQRLQLGRV
jgi:hypothetical protein